MMFLFANVAHETFSETTLIDQLQRENERERKDCDYFYNIKVNGIDDQIIITLINRH